MPIQIHPLFFHRLPVAGAAESREDSTEALRNPNPRHQRPWHLPNRSRLVSQPRVLRDVFEVADYIGGHNCTVTVDETGRSVPIDTGFMVFMHPTDPHLTRPRYEFDIE
jgi:hypothetical protein